MGSVSHEDVRKAIAEAARTGELTPRVVVDKRGIEGAGYTTAANLEAERRLLAAELRGREGVAALASPIAAARLVSEAALRSQDQGHTWTADQRQATMALLTR